MIVSFTQLTGTSLNYTLCKYKSRILNVNLPESTLAIIFPDFQTNSEGEQVAVRGEWGILLRWQ